MSLQSFKPFHGLVVELFTKDWFHVSVVLVIVRILFTGYVQVPTIKFRPPPVFTTQLQPIVEVVTSLRSLSKKIATICRLFLKEPEHRPLFSTLQNLFKKIFGWASSCQSQVSRGLHIKFRHFWHFWLWEWTSLFTIAISEFWRVEVKGNGVFYDLNQRKVPIILFDQMVS